MSRQIFPTSLTKIISISFTAFVFAILVISYQSFSGLNIVTSNFNVLSERILPLAQTNNAVSLLILKESNLIKDAVRAETSESLNVLIEQSQKNRLSSQQVMKQLDLFVDEHGALSRDKYQNIVKSSAALYNSADKVLQLQQSRLIETQKMESEIETFRYGLMSIGPEFSRIANMFAFDNPEAMDAANRFIANASRMESLFLLILMEKSPEKARELYKQLKTSLAAIMLAYDDFKDWYNVFSDFPSFSSPMQIVTDGFADKGIVLRALAQIDHFTELNSELDKAAATSLQTISQLENISKQAERNITAKQQFVTNNIEKTKITQLVLNLAVILITIIGWLRLCSWINLGMRTVTAGLDRLTQKNFTQQIVARGPLELCKIAQAINLVIDAMSQSLIQVKSTARDVNDFSSESVQAAKENQRALELQNQTLSSMSTAVGQIEVSIREISRLAQISVTESRNTVTYTNDGISLLEASTTKLNNLDQVLNANEVSMNTLEGCVHQIQGMVDLITGIAENTNLLALNAAIEAARAGEQGRGFSVVADEVRRLASDTSTQTAKISLQMNQLVNAATDSKKAVQQSRDEMTQSLAANADVKRSFSSIAGAVHSMVDQIEQISHATEEQELATSSVNQSIIDINDQSRQTEKNLASMVGTSQKLADEAGQQQQMLTEYRFE